VVPGRTGGAATSLSGGDGAVAEALLHGPAGAGETAAIMTETPEDLARDQYRDSTKLNARVMLHAKYGGGGGMPNLTRELELRPAAKVLEVGCGFGRFWLGAQHLSPDLDIMLTDLSPGMVQEALVRVRAVGRWPALHGQVADVCALPFADATFDVVLAMHMLYHAADPAKGVREIARVLLPGGIAIVTTNGLGNMAELFSLGASAFGGPDADPGAADFSLESAEPMLRSVFAEVELRRFASTMNVTDPADIVAYLRSFPPGDRATASEIEHLGRLADEAFSADGGVFQVHRDVGYLVARKPTLWV